MLFLSLKKEQQGERLLFSLESIIFLILSSHAPPGLWHTLSVRSRAARC